MLENQPYPTATKFKRLTIFALASGSLLLSGFLLRQDWDWKIISILLWCNVSGVFLIYRLNDCIDQDRDLKFSLSHFFSFPLHLIVVAQFVLLTIPLAVYLLDWFALTTLYVSALIGIFYSLSFKINGKQFRIKNVFLLKNILIGLVWGGLILIGAGGIHDVGILSLFVFVSVQVVIGSMIRDVPDLEKDQLSGVKSLPVVLGLPATFVFMHLLNFASFSSGIFISWSWQITLLMLIVIGWRSINLIFLQKNPASILWGQKVNLVTCMLIPLILISIYFFSNVR